MPQLIMKLDVNRVDLVDEGANSAAFIKMYKRRETNDSMELKDILSKMKPEHAAIVSAEIEKAKKEIPAETATALQTNETDLAKAKDELEVAKKACTDAENKLKDMEKEDKTNTEDVMKSLDPAVKALFDKMQATADEAVNKAKALEESNLTTVAIAKAKELSFIPVEEEKLVTIMKSASPEVIEVLKAANKCIGEGGLFTEVGKARGNSANGDAWDKIEKKADELSKSEQISKQKAISQVIKENPDLYREYLKGGN